MAASAKKVEAIIHNVKEFEKTAGERGSLEAFLETPKPLPEPEQVKALPEKILMQAAGAGYTVLPLCVGVMRAACPLKPLSFQQS